MFLSNDDARKAVFANFDAFQDTFSALITTYANATTARERAAIATTARERAAIATRFVKDVVIPYLDASKDALLKEYAQPLQAIEAELSKLMRVFGEASA